MNDIETRRLEILDECLSQVQSGVSSVSDCLKAYPEHEEYLKSHLTIALYTRDLLAPPQPSQEFATQTKIRLTNQIRAQLLESRRSHSKRTRRGFGFLRPAYAFVAMLIAFVFFASGIGVVNASASALPGDLLYNIKLGIEETRLAISQNPVTDAELLIQFADTRIEEVMALTEAARDDDIDQALAGYENLISQLINLTDEDEITSEPETLNKIHYGLEHHQEVLQRVLLNAPPSASKGINNALNRSEHGKRVIEQIQNGGSPSDLPPGQQDQNKEKEKENQGNPPNDRGGRRNHDRTPGPPPTKTPKDKDSDDTPGRPPTKTPNPKDK